MQPRLARFLRFTAVLMVVAFFISNQVISKRKYQYILELKQELIDKGNYDLDKDFGSREALSHEKVVYKNGPAADYNRVNACFFTLARNDDLMNLATTVRSVEDRFNHQFHYDWIFVNDEDFSDEFKSQLSNIVSGKAEFAKIPKEFWSYPSWIDLKKAQRNRIKSGAEMIYGAKETYRFMCRFFSGFFYKMDVLRDYDYVWRVEPETLLHCDVKYDVFKYMIDNDKHYGFTISIREFEQTIPTLWTTVQNFMELNPQYIQPDNLLNFISSDQGQTYNLCHFWTNFEIIDLRFLRSEAYQHYFDFLDSANGFFYERWGDAPVLSIALALFLPRSNIHFFEDIGYYHKPMNNCPINNDLWKQNNCLCDQRQDVTYRAYSCTPIFQDIMGIPKADGWEQHRGE